MRKKVLNAILALSLLIPFGMTIPIHADDSVKTTDVKYRADSHYTWNIHDAVDFGKDGGINHQIVKQANKVSVTQNVIAEGQSLSISIQGNGDNNAFTISNGKTEILDYTVKKENTNVQTGTEILNVPAGTNTGSTNLTFTLNTRKTGAEVAGQYHGTVTYDASLISEHNWMENGQEERSICNLCGQDITGITTEHNKQHALNGESGGYHMEYRMKYTCSDCGAVKYEAVA